MAQIIIDIPNASAPRIQDAFASEFGWTADNGMTKTQFTKLQVIKFIKQTVKNSEGNLQAGQARQAIESDVENIVIS